LTRPWSASAFRAAIRRRERAFGGRWPTVVLSNHDQRRHASRLADSVGAIGPDRDAIARAAAVLSLSIRGTPFLYYGEELGMGDVEIPPDESIDPPAARVGPDFPWWDRSAARTPMPWAAGPGAGFTTGTPWLRLGPDVGRRNVAAQAADPGSVLSCYRRVLRARRGARSLQDGTLTLSRTAHPDVLGFRRRGSGEEILVLVGFAATPMVARVPRPPVGRRWQPLVGSHLDPGPVDPAASTTTLRPFEGVIFTASPA
jgi:alpha-glucosidase